MADIEPARRALVARILEGDGHASRDARSAAFAGDGLTEPVRALVHKVADRSGTVTDTDVHAVRSAGADEDEIFELVVCAAIGRATHLHELALAALDAATTQE
jgi:hypothetical protein